MNKISKPIVITPYDDIVQEAVTELGPSLKNVDIIKLEPYCPDNKLAWVTNKDLLKNKPGKEKIIHLCLKKIKDTFEKQYKKNYSITNPKDNKKLKNIIKNFLVNVVLPHEATHIQQEIKYKGSFGKNPEAEAEKAEHWEKLKPYNITKKSHSILTQKLDTLANSLENKGLIKEALHIDIISNTLEKTASLDLYLEHLIHYMKAKKRNFNDLYDKLLKGLKLWPFPKNTNVNKIIPNLWKKALLSVAGSPTKVKYLIRSFNLNPKELEKLIMPIEELASLANMTSSEFLEFLNEPYTNHN